MKSIPERNADLKWKAGTHDILLGMIEWQNRTTGRYAI